MRTVTKIFSTLALTAAGVAAAIAPASAVPYSNGLTLAVGNLLFTFNSCSVTSLAFGPPPISGVGTTDCSQLNFTPIAPAGMFGFAINGGIVSVNGAVYDVALQYSIDVLPPASTLVHDAHLVVVGGTVGPGAVTAVDETIFDSSGFDGALHVTTSSPVDSTNLLRDALHLEVAKDILTFSAAPGSVAEISIVDQFFSEVPEPTLTAFAGLALTGLGLMRRRRKTAA